MRSDTSGQDDSFAFRKARELTNMALDSGLVVEHELATASDDIEAGRNRILDGARLVVKAWRDPEFKHRLIHDPAAALAQMGLAMGKHSDDALNQELLVVANSETLHNIIVCTLCSCYPRAILGPPPQWYTSQEYRSRVVVEPRAVLKEFGLELPEGIAIRVWDSTAETRYMVLPEAPKEIGSHSDSELIARITSDVLIGTARSIF